MHWSDLLCKCHRLPPGLIPRLCVGTNKKITCVGDKFILDFWRAVEGTWKTVWWDSKVPRVLNNLGSRGLVSRSRRLMPVGVLKGQASGEVWGHASPESFKLRGSERLFYPFSWRNFLKKFQFCKRSKCQEYIKGAKTFFNFYPTALV